MIMAMYRNTLVKTYILFFLVCIIRCLLDNQAKTVERVWMKYTYIWYGNRLYLLIFGLGY